MSKTSPPMSVNFDSGPLGTGSVFTTPDHVIEAWEADQVPEALRAMEDAQKAGKWLAGAASYELGYALISKIAGDMPENRNEPLLRFGVFDAPQSPQPRDDLGDFNLSEFAPEWGFETYSDAFSKVRKYLKNGDIYQVNLTFPLYADLQGSTYALYEYLKATQPVPHGALVDLGDTKLLSRSPELFFALSETGEIRARPMKGTIRRGDTPAEDDALKNQLAASEKNQAENLMITDLLRNDIGRIAEIGSVHVPKLFAIESYATVHQMTSDVVAQVQPNTSITDIFEALFPCGSITGAPKIRAMEILSDLETTPRGPYCGAIGWIAPSGAMEFSVAIRTLVCEPSGKVTLNVGGGVVYDSTAQSEYDEAILKAEFAQSASTKK